jgi:hypothetical protein
MRLVRIDLLKHIEAFSEKRVSNIKQKMLDSGIWQKPISIDQEHLLILDGQHRYEVALALGLKYIPCEFFDFNDDELLVWSLRKEYEVSKQLVIERALSGNIYPYKTAKHKFPRKVEKVMIPLEELQSYSRCRKDIIGHSLSNERKIR